MSVFTYTVCGEKVKTSAADSIHQKLNEVYYEETSRKYFTKRCCEKCLLPPVLGIEIPVKQNVELCKATVFIQKLLRGRAIQYKVFQDRKRFQPLIEELKKTHSLEKEQNYLISENRYEVLSHMRKQFLYRELAGKRCQLVNQFNGEITTEMLDFLAKELQRLETEKQVHAFAMLAERERWRREAIESGRRQKEDFFRKQHDEMFKQVMNIRNETVDMFLEDMLAKSIGWLADDEARQYVRNVAQKVDRAAQQAHAKKDAIEQDEMVMDLICNYLMPQVNKTLVRQKLQSSQRKYLELADNFIQNKFARSESAIQTFRQSADDEHTVDIHESRSASKDDVNLERSETSVSSKLLVTNVMKTHCLPQTKSEEEYYHLDLQKELERSKLFQLIRLAGVVNNDFLDELITMAENMAQKIVDERAGNLSIEIKQSSRSFFSLYVRDALERSELLQLIGLAKAVKYEFLDDLIVRAESEAEKIIRADTSVSIDESVKSEEKSEKYQSNQSLDNFFSNFENKFESQKRIKISQLIILSENLNNDFLDELIAVAESEAQKLLDIKANTRLMENNSEENLEFFTSSPSNESFQNAI